MIIVDALIACALVYFFGTEMIPAMIITCMVTFLRMYMKVNNLINAFYEGLDAMFNKEEVK